MGEIKSVKVDNWGVFFLQKLQNFFNKTDYCDLTLQFNDNSQLKVHRLVLSACTDYFNVLEQTCEMIDDVLIMPLELQADVVVPIVNFMYTGTLEFELRMYGRLLKTAKDMNMTVLLKLLEAHRRTMEKSPTMLPTIRNNQRTTNYQRKTPVSTQRRGPQNTTNYKSIQIKPVTPYYSNSGTNATKYKSITTIKAVKGPSRFDYPPEGKVLPPETFEQSFDTISYESKPLICKEEPDSENYEGLIQKSSPFEELRRGYNNNKRPASSVSSFESPPEKKPNIEDVKEYAEQQRMRKQIAQEFDDDNEYEETLDDEFHHDDDDDDYIPPSSYQKQTKQQHQVKKPNSNQQQQQQPIVIKQENNRPTIVVKDTPNSNVNHAKIISEVLRKYPHLVKNNKNIKLKILPKTSGVKSEPQKIVFKKEAVDQRPVAVPKLPPPSVKHNTYPSAAQRSTTSTHLSVAAGTSLLQSKVSPKTNVSVKAANTSSSATSDSSQPRRIDSKTMYSLIAMGAENRTGPWLCLRCGVNGRPISIPSYRGFRRHLINVHQEKIDPRLCEHCGWRSTNNRELYHHMLVEHKIKPPSAYSFPKCELCDTILLNYSDLEKHIAENHEEGIEVNQNCIYCNRTFANENMLYAHMKSQHKDRAKEDGVIDFSEDDEIAFESDSQLSQYHSDTGSEQKIKILSDISLPKNIPIIQAEDNAPGTTITLPANVLETDSKVNDASKGPKFVNADGKEMELTEEQRQEIISQLGNQEHGAVVMVLNDDAEQLSSVLSSNASESAPATASATASTSASASTSTSAQATTVPAVEKEQHKPRKTKHTVKTEMEDVEEGEEMIEWLDEESGNIMKLPLSKFAQMEEDDEEGEEEEEEEDVETDGETEEAVKETEEVESADEEKSVKAKNKKSSTQVKEESNDDKSVGADETTSDSIKDKKEDKKRKDSTSDHEAEEKDETTESEQNSKPKDKSRGEVSKAMETLKILTGDWTDEDEDEDQSTNKAKLDSSTEESKNHNSKDEEILFETIAVSEENIESNDESKENDEKNCKSVENEEKEDDKKKERKDSEMDFDNISATEQDDNILKMNDDEKMDETIDDDMKIIEELKNYEQEQLEAEAEAEAEAETAAAETETKENSNVVTNVKQLRSKSKSKSASTSPTMNENSNSGSSNISATSTTSDKPKKRGRPRKTPIIEEKKIDNQDKDDDDDKETTTTDNKEPESIQKTEKSKELKENTEENIDDSKDEDLKIPRKLSTDENSQSSVKSDHEESKKSDKDETVTDLNVTETTSQEPKNTSDIVSTDNNDGLITKAEIRNLISDWGDDDDDDL